MYYEVTITYYDVIVCHYYIIVIVMYCDAMWFLHNDLL